MRHVPIVSRPIFGLGEDVDHHVVDEIVYIDELRDRLIGRLSRDASIGHVRHSLPIVH